jgi:hypothetical protein
MAVDYSSTPLFKKLGYKEGYTVKLIDPPPNYNKLIGEIIKDVELTNAKQEIDLIHFFVNKKRDLEKQLPVLMKQIRKNGMIWVSWYKKSAKKPSELDDCIIRDTGLAFGLVDVKVCAVDEEWSALKFVYRLKDR